jgi:hypothetical protein
MAKYSKIEKEIRDKLQLKLKPTVIFVCGDCGMEKYFSEKKELIDHILKEHKMKEILDYI